MKQETPRHIPRNCFIYATSAGASISSAEIPAPLRRSTAISREFTAGLRFAEVYCGFAGIAAVLRRFTAVLRRFSAVSRRFSFVLRRSTAVLRRSPTAVLWDFAAPNQVHSLHAHEAKKSGARAPTARRSANFAAGYLAAAPPEEWRREI